jgi:hypothetical protein
MLFNFYLSQNVFTNNHLNTSLNFEYYLKQKFF